MLVGVVVAALVSTGCSAGGGQHAAPTMREIRTLLARHGQAVRDHDRAGFLADVDPASRAAGFRARQAGEFTNLVQLPLTTWSYTAATRTDDRAAEATASRTFGSPAVIVRVELRFALRGVDAAPARHDLWWTFVRHDGKVVVAADDGLADAGGVSWRGPWDFGPLDVVAGSRSLVLGHVQDDVAVHAIAATVDDAVPAVSAVWGTGWSQDVAVVIPGSAAELAAQLGQRPDATQVAAVAISDGQDPVSGAVYGQRLIVNPAALTRLSAIGRQITIRHEITHIATARDTSATTPRWLSEGFAEYVANLHTGQSVRSAARELGAEVRAGRLPTALPDAASFDASREAAPAYEAAWLACRLIAQRIGQQGLVRFYRAVGAAAGTPDAAVGNALRSVVGQSAAQFVRQWRNYLQAELG